MSDRTDLLGGSQESALLMSNRGHFDIGGTVSLFERQEARLTHDQASKTQM